MKKSDALYHGMVEGSVDFTVDNGGEHDGVVNLNLTNEMRDEIQNWPLQKMAEFYSRHVLAHLAVAESVVSDLKVIRDYLRFQAIPEKMDAENLQSMNIRGVGTLYLSEELLVSTKQAMGPALREWMKENGFEDLVVESINSSTLGGWVREQMREGQPVPDHLLNILPRTRAAVKGAPN